MADIYSLQKYTELIINLFIKRKDIFHFNNRSSFRQNYVIKVMMIHNHDINKLISRMTTLGSTKNIKLLIKHIYVHDITKQPN